MNIITELEIYSKSRKGEIADLTRRAAEVIRKQHREIEELKKRAKWEGRA